MGKVRFEGPVHQPLQPDPDPDPDPNPYRYAQFNKHFALNSGLFYLRANERTLSLMTRLETRLSKQKYWDQTAYNEEIFFLSHGSYKSPQVTVRVMEIDKVRDGGRGLEALRLRHLLLLELMSLTSDLCSDLFCSL